MRRLGQAARFLAVVLPAVLLGSACDSSRERIEIISGLGEEKATIRVACSDEVSHVFRSITDGYSSRHNVQFAFQESQSGKVLEMLDRKEADLGVTAKRLLPSNEAGEISYIPFAYDGAVFFASADAKVRSLSAAQIRRILSGEVSNWREAGGADRPIRVIGRPPYSSVSTALGNSFFGGKFPRARDAFVIETSEGTYQAFKSLHSFLAVAPMSRTMVEEFPVVPLTVDGMEPLMSNVPGGKYPARIEYGVLFRRDAPEPVKSFAGYLVSLEGMHRMASLGLVPAPRNLPLSACHCRVTDGTFDPARAPEMAGVFIIAVVPELGTIEQEKRYAALCRLIADGLGVRTQLKHMATYGQVVREFGEGRVDAAFVGSLVYGQLHEAYRVVPVARPEKDGVSHYHGTLIVRADRPFRSFADLHGRSFAYVPDTTAGEVFPMTLLGTAAAGGLDGYFGRVEKVQSHADVIRLVELGRVDGGAVKDLVLKRKIAENPKLSERIRILGTSPDVPENALVVNPQIGEAQRRRLLEILTSANGKDAGKAALASLGVTRFIPTTHDDYANLYEMAKTARYAFRKR